MTTLSLVRHGETAGNCAGVFQGTRAYVLTQQGRQQAYAAAARLAAEQVTAVYSSDLRRALDTAGIIAQGCRCFVYPTPAWREWDMGVWTGQKTAGFYNYLHAQHLSPATYVPTGGESWGQLQARLLSALAAVATAHPTGHVVCVTHGKCIEVLVQALRGQPLHLHLPYVANGSLTRLVWDGAAWTVAAVNDVGHLEGLPADHGGAARWAAVRST